MPRGMSPTSRPFTPSSTRSRSASSTEVDPSGALKDPPPGVVILLERGRCRDPRGPAVTSELVARAQRGDPEAFEALATRAWDQLCAVARRILRDPEASEDAAQAARVHAR